MPRPFVLERLTAASGATSEDRAEVIEVPGGAVIMVADGQAELPAVLLPQTCSCNTSGVPPSQRSPVPLHGVDPLPLQVVTASASFRKGSEDRFAVHHAVGGLVIVVADGAGGIPGGGPAADLLLAHVEGALADTKFDVFVASSWIDLLRSVDALVERDRAAGETTAVIVAVTDSGLVVGASSGDSGALVVRKDGTVDELTEGQHRKRRIGSGSAVPVGFDRPALDGTLVVASDGLLGYARPNVIAEVVLATEDLDDAASSLVDRVRLPSGGLMDDVAVVLVRLG
jgi:serine/threonine protein phosphatase PrpC